MTSSKEERALSEFKERIKEYSDEKNLFHSDSFLIRWLIARDFNVDKAVKMFLDNVEFRKRYKVDTIKDDFIPNEILKKYVTGGFIGYDKDGSVVRVELFGKLDMKGLMYTCKKSDLERLKILECDQIVQMWKDKHDKDNDVSISDKLTIIYDMEGTNISNMWRPGLLMYIHLLHLLEDNYPEMLKRMLVINPPAIFPFLWNLSKPLVTEIMRKKIHFLKEPYEADLLKYIDAKVLPKCYGGDRTDSDGDPRCKDIIMRGGIIPKELYNIDMVNVSDADTIKISHGEEYFIKKEVKIPNSILRWEFKTSSYDLGFGLSFENDECVKKLVIPISRVNCHLVPEEGSFECREVGIYTLIFDNTFSMTRGKVVEIFCELLDPDLSYETEMTGP